MKCINLYSKTYTCCIGTPSTTKSKDEFNSKVKNKDLLLKIKSASVRIGTLLLIICPFAIFCATVLVWYVDTIGWTVPILTSFLFLASLTSFLLSCFSNPGVIPSQKGEHLQYDLFKGYSSYPNSSYNYIGDSLSINYETVKNYRDLHMNIGGKLVKIKFCTTCNIFRSPRAVHCRICNVCVHRFDHHCKWLDNCIGYNNYRYFIAFIVSTFLLLIAILILTVIRLIYIKTPPFSYITRISNIGVNKSFITNIVFITILFLIIVSSGWFVIGLLIYHSYLIATNQTTNEQLKGVFQNFNPHNRGFFINLMDALFKKHNIDYSSSLKNSIYNPVSEYNDYDNLSLIDHYLISEPNTIYKVTEHFTNETEEKYTVKSSSNSVESSSSSEHSVQNSSNSIDINTSISSNFEDIGGLEGSINDMINDYNRLKSGLNQAKLFNQHVVNIIENDTNINHHTVDEEVDYDKKFTRKNGIDIKKSRLMCCKK